jgi:hypothetical protein
MMMMNNVENEEHKTNTAPKTKDCPKTKTDIEERAMLAINTLTSRNSMNADRDGGGSLLTGEITSFLLELLKKDHAKGNGVVSYTVGWNKHNSQNATNMEAFLQFALKTGIVLHPLSVQASPEGKMAFLRAATILGVNVKPSTNRKFAHKKIPAYFAMGGEGKQPGKKFEHLQTEIKANPTTMHYMLVYHEFMPIFESLLESILSPTDLAKDEIPQSKIAAVLGANCWALLRAFREVIASTTNKYGAQDAVSLSHFDWLTKTMRPVETFMDLTAGEATSISLEEVWSTILPTISLITNSYKNPACKDRDQNAKNNVWNLIMKMLFRFSPFDGTPADPLVGIFAVLHYARYDKYRSGNVSAAEFDEMLTWFVDRTRVARRALKLFTVSDYSETDIRRSSFKGMVKRAFKDLGYGDGEMDDLLTKEFIAMDQDPSTFPIQLLPEWADHNVKSTGPSLGREVYARYTTLTDPGATNGAAIAALMNKGDDSGGPKGHLDSFIESCKNSSATEKAKAIAMQRQNAAMQRQNARDAWMEDVTKRVY